MLFPGCARGTDRKGARMGGKAPRRNIGNPAFVDRDDLPVLIVDTKQKAQADPPTPLDQRSTSAFTRSFILSSILHPLVAHLTYYEMAGCRHKMEDEMHEFL